jgi:hypothetical protein
MQIVRIGSDLAKYVFEIHGVDAHGKTVVRKTASPSCRVSVLRQPATLPYWRGGFERRTLLGEGAF